MTQRYLEPTQESGKALFSRQIEGAVIMLNLLRFRDVADYSSTPDIAPSEPISGRKAYQKYIELTLPFLTATGGEIVLLGDGGPYLIGPTDEHWDLVMLIRQHSVQDFHVLLNERGLSSRLGTSNSSFRRLTTFAHRSVPKH